MNMQALEAILSSANEKKIKVLLYISPLRNDFTIPYDGNQYSNFKTEVKLIANELGIRFYNLENLVPSRYWGAKDTTSLGGGEELDFMHFQTGGHQLLANFLYKSLKELWDEGNNNAL